MVTTVAEYGQTADAQAAVEELIAGGWPREAISVVSPSVSDADEAHLAAHDTEKGAVIGGLSGLLIGVSEVAVPGAGIVLLGGWIAAAVLGAGVGAIAGGLVGLLLQAGLSAEHARHAAAGIGSGATVVLLRSEDRLPASVRALLEQHGASAIREESRQNQPDE